MIFKSFSSHLFRMTDGVTRVEYLAAGLLLAPLKYCVEAITIFRMTGKVYTPLDFINPLLSSREFFSSDHATWLGMAWIA